MGKVRLTLFILSFLSFSTVHLAQAFNAPESAVYDYLNLRYLVTNVDDGNIIAISAEGTLSYFNQGSSTSLRGITIFENTVYAAGDEGVQVYDLTGQNTQTIPVPGSTWLNDIVADPNGMLYVSDNSSEIWLVDPNNQTSVLFTNAINDPNGLIYDGTNDLLIATQEPLFGGEEGSIVAMNVITTDITELVTVPSKWLDGLAVDAQGYYYVSSWFTDCIYQFDPYFANPPEIIAYDMNGPADFCYNAVNNELGAPKMTSDEFIIIDLGSPVGIEDDEFIPVEFSLLQNYPNPFNPTTVIRYILPEQSMVSLKVYDSLGREISTLENGVKNAGTYQINFDAAGLSTGIYFYTIQAGDFFQTKKMLMLK